MNEKEQQELKRLKSELKKTEYALECVNQESAYFSEQWKMAQVQLLYKDDTIELYKKALELKEDMIISLKGTIERLIRVTK